MTFDIEVKMTFEVEAGSDAAALEVVLENMIELNETLSDHLVREWTLGDMTTLPLKGSV